MSGTYLLDGFDLLSWLCWLCSQNLAGDLQQPCGVAVINFLQYRVRQIDAINPPAALRRNLRRRVIKIFVVGLEKTVVNLVELVVKHLLRKCFSVRRRVGTKKNPILILFKEFSRGARLTP